MRSIIAFFILLFAVSTHAQSAFQNIQTAAALDIIAPFDFEDSDQNTLQLRAAELLFFGPLDPTFDARINFSVHTEEGETVLDIEEAFVGSSKLIPNSRFKVGKFMLGIGRLNQFHLHDWPFISAPRVQKEFFGDEGVRDSGLEFSTLLPLETYWDITMGVTNGYSFAESHDHDHEEEEHTEKPRVPTHYIHPVNFVDFGEAGALQWGFQYVGRTDAEGEQMQLYGLDFVFKKQEGKTLNFLFQSEIWYRNMSAEGSSASEEVGAYFYPQVSLSQQIYAGIRLDVFSELTLEEAGERQKNWDYAFVPTLTYKHSEFSWLRAAYSVDTKTQEGQSDTVNQKIELQWVAILGAHPAHSF